MTTQAENFVRAYLGPAATCPPSEAARKALRKWLLLDMLDQPIDTGKASSERQRPGCFEDLYAVHHGVVTPEEMRLRWDSFLDIETKFRGLPDGPLAEPITHVYKSTHYTVIQLWTIALFHPEPARRKLAGKCAVALRELALKDSLFTKEGWIGPSRAIGWVGEGLWEDYNVTGSSLTWAYKLAGKVSKGEDAEGHVWLWQNEAAKKDTRHVYDQCPWMDAVLLQFLARLYTTVPSPDLRDLILHGLRVMQQAQLEDGLFVDDIGFDADGVWGSKSDGEPVMDPWIWASLHAAYWALGGDWPSWAQTMMNRCRERFMASNRFKPSSPLWREPHNQSISIACASLWGWRD